MRVSSVFFSAVSRTLEPSLQSSFQRSLTVLVLYRSRAQYLALDGVHHPSLGCILKQPDSWKAFSEEHRRQNGSYTHYGKGPGQGDLDSDDTPDSVFLTLHFPRPLARSGDSAMGSSLFTRRY